MLTHGRLCDLLEIEMGDDDLVNQTEDQAGVPLHIRPALFQSGEHPLAHVLDQLGRPRRAGMPKPPSARNPNPRITANNTKRLINLTFFCLLKEELPDHLFQDQGRLGLRQAAAVRKMVLAPAGARPIYCSPSRPEVKMLAMVSSGMVS
jgi:hypothetical protein